MASPAHHGRQLREEAAMGATTNSSGARPGHAIDQRAMTAVDPANPDLSPQQPARSPADAPTTVAASFRPLDAGIVNDTIPAFFIGRNREGFWVARDARGRIGGIFLLRDSAVSFARRNSEPATCVTIFPSEAIELDLDNKGNLLVAQLAWLKRLAKRCRQRVVTFVGHMTQAMKQSRSFGSGGNSPG
jgi:hypothetical protein